MITVKYYKGLPLEYESFLVEKYQSYTTTCRYIEIYYPTLSFCYFTVYKNDMLIELLIFGKDRNTAKCLNLFVEIDQKILTKCLRLLFEVSGEIYKIVFDASYKKYSFAKTILYSQSNDHIIKLHSKIEDYYSELGRSTRRTLKKQKSKLLRDYPGVKFNFKFREEIDEGIIAKIIQLNFDRMKQKGIVYGNNHDIKSIYKYSQYVGLVTYIEIDGNVVAGTISYIINKKLFGYVVGHDSYYSKYSLGIICQLIEIQKSIELKLSTYHFLWGDNEYKKRLLAEPYSLYSYYIFRNYSLNYGINKVKAMVSMTSTNIRHSKKAKPLREAVKNYRKKRIREQIN